jgi:putative transposase
MQSRAEELAAKFAGSATTIEELNQLMRLMMKSGLERMLDTKMDVHLGRSPWASGDTELPPAATQGPPNRRNGRSKKTVQGGLGEVTLSTPRDREGTFEPQIVGKHRRRIPDFDEKLLALYAQGMTTRDIQEIVQDLYGVEVSATLVSEITADWDAEVTSWRSRTLDAMWPIVYFDGSVLPVRAEKLRVSQHTIYVALGVNLDGKKELLGLWLSENEGAKFWLSCLTGLNNRGLSDIFVACIDGLSGFAEAIHAAYPRTKVQLCIAHLVRAALRFVSTEDTGPVARDLKGISPSERRRRRWRISLKPGTANTGRLPSSGGPNGPTSSRCSTSRHPFGGRLLKSAGL